MSVASVVYRGYTHELRSMPGYTGGVSITDRVESASAPPVTDSSDSKHVNKNNLNRLDRTDVMAEAETCADWDCDHLLSDLARELLAADKIREGLNKGVTDGSAGAFNVDRGQRYQSIGQADDRAFIDSPQSNISSPEGTYENLAGFRDLADRFNENRFLVNDKADMVLDSLAIASDSLKMAADDVHMGADAMYKPANHQERRTTEDPIHYFFPPIAGPVDNGDKGPGPALQTDSRDYMHNKLIPGKVDLDLGEPESLSGSDFNFPVLETGRGFRLDLASLDPEDPIMLAPARMTLDRDTLQFDTGVIFRDDAIEAFTNFVPRPDHRIGNDEDEVFMNRRPLPMSLVNPQDYQEQLTPVARGRVVGGYTVGVPEANLQMEAENARFVPLASVPASLDVRPIKVAEIAEVPIGVTPRIESAARTPLQVGLHLSDRFTDEFPIGHFVPKIDSNEGDLEPDRPIFSHHGQDHIFGAGLSGLHHRLGDGLLNNIAHVDFNPGVAPNFLNRQWKDLEFVDVEKNVQNKHVEKTTENHLYGRDDPRIQEVLVLKERVDTFALIKAVQESDASSPGYQEPQLHSRADVTQYTTKGLLVDAITWGWSGQEPNSF